MRPTLNYIVRKPLCVHTVAVASFYSCMCTEPLTPLTWQKNFLNVNLCIGLNYFLFLLTPSTWFYSCILNLLKDSMQHGPLTPLTYPGSSKICFLCIPVFDRKIVLIFPIIYLRIGLRAHLHIHLSDLVNPLISASSMSWMTHLLTLGTSFPFSHVSWLLIFIE